MSPNRKPNHRRVESLKAMVRGSVGSRSWQHAYFTVAGKKRDLVAGGKVSCAFFVSSILKLFNLIGAVHLTVASTIADMERHGWVTTRRPRSGCIICWEPLTQGGAIHTHLGFYLDKNQAISNDWKRRTPVLHHRTYHGRRRITAYYTHPNLDGQ